VRVKITVVSVVITFVSVKIRMRVEITLCLYKSHSHTCQNYSRLIKNHTLRKKSHFACGNRNLRVEITLWRVGITFVLVLITLRVEIRLVGVIFTRIRLKLTFACVEIKSTLCVQKPILCMLNSHSGVLKLNSACINHTRVCLNHTC
jgi:hypothetical protein